MDSLDRSQSSFESAVKDICHRNGVGLYDIEFVKTQHGRILCVYITKIGGATIEDCTNVTRALNIYLDTNDTLFDGPYTLEVSSPGIERPLKFKKHYISAINETIKISFINTENIENTQVKPIKETIVGILKEVNNDYIILQKKDAITDTNIAFQNIKKARTIATDSLFKKK